MNIKRTLTFTVTLLTLGISFAFGEPTEPLSLEENNKETNQATVPMDEIQRFSAAIGQIKSYYVNKVDDKKLFENAIRGMLSGLDPHSSYLDEKEFKELTASTQGEFAGLGIEVTMEQGVLKVISPIDDTPASKAGLKSGDYIIRIDDKSMQDVPLNQAVEMMRGKQGTEIKLTILRKNEEKPLHFTLTREVIKIKSIKAELLNKQFAYVRLSHFQEPTSSDLLAAIEKLRQESNGKLNGLILDLRNNPGGLLDSAIEVSDAFINDDKKGPREMIVYTKGRVPGSDIKAYATVGDVMKSAPMVVLINGGSASASEIVAGALKDNKRAVIMGTKSFGKGSVQTVIPLDDKSGIKLTTALYYTPSGRSIQAEGIEPDVVVEDVKMPKAEKNIAESLGISEADLANHLSNGNKKDANNAKAKTAKSNLFYSDYQLYEALNLLEGMSIARRQ